MRLVICELPVKHRLFIFFFQAEDGIRDVAVTGVQTCALPISDAGRRRGHSEARDGMRRRHLGRRRKQGVRSEEHTSELQSRLHLVCRLLLEKKKKALKKGGVTNAVSLSSVEAEQP